MFGWFKRLRRKKIAAQPVPKGWIDIVEAKIPFYQRLTPKQREHFWAQLKIFVAEKHIEGAQGFEVTEEVKVIIAAIAVRMTLYLGVGMYDRLTEIVVYAGDYKHPERKDGIIYGEAHSFGTVVLSWDAVMRGITHAQDGNDTATHEFAHVLDVADGVFDGTPVLSSLRHYKPWAEVMSKHYLALVKGKRDERRVLDTYGATNEAEFFAVVSESFFEKPHQLRERLPELYAQLREFYGWDPALPPEEQPEPPASQLF